MFSVFKVLFLLYIFDHTRAANATCNGDASLCSKAYSNVTFLGAHNSAAVGTSISDNQHYGVATQLHDGIRFLQGQGHNKTSSSGSGISICHSSCDLQDGGTLEKYLTKVKTWIQANPDNVITILWVNSDNMPISAWAEAYTTSGLANYSYTPSSDAVTGWPTLSTLINAGTPVVNFITSQADHSSVPYLLGEWSNIWETPYENTNYNNFTCELDRGTTASPLYLANHFAYSTMTFLGASIDSPDTDHISKTNAESSVLAHAEMCSAEHSKYPNFLLVDYYEKASGGALQAVAKMNDITYVGGKLGTGSANAIATFFGGQNEIRNIAIVVGIAIAVLLSVWIGICCCNKRKARRRSNSMEEELIKPYEKSAFTKPSVATPPSFTKTLFTAPRYAPLQEDYRSYNSPGTDYTSMAADPMSYPRTHEASNAAFNDIRGGSRPCPPKSYYHQPSY